MDIKIGLDSLMWKTRILIYDLHMLVIEQQEITKENTYTNLQHLRTHTVTYSTPPTQMDEI